MGCEQQKKVFSPEFQENINTRLDKGFHCGIVIGVVSAERTAFYSYGTRSTKTNEPMDAFPESWMSYDTYAEVLLENSEKEKAIKHFKKSLELNPHNYSALETWKSWVLKTKKQNNINTNV